MFARLLLATALALPLATPSHAVIGTLDRVPAATLLLPHFRVAPTAGPPTLVTLASVASTGQLARVTVWSNLGVPVFAFDVYLPPRGSTTLDLRALLQVGTLPSRAAPNTFDCLASDFPGQVPAATLTALQQQLRGLDPGNGFVAAPTTDLEGYLTVDATHRCTDLFPSDSGYFAAGGQGLASNNNVLLGDFAQGDTDTPSMAESLVAIEASATSAETSVAGQYTFYGAFDGYSADDNREPLGTRWTAKIPPGSEVIVWRDPQRLPLAPTDADGIEDALLSDADRIMLGDPTGFVYEMKAFYRYPHVTQRVVAPTESPLSRPPAFIDLVFGNRVAPGAEVPAPENPDVAQSVVFVLAPAIRCGAGKTLTQALAYDTAARTEVISFGAPPPPANP